MCHSLFSKADAFLHNLFMAKMFDDVSRFSLSVNDFHGDVWIRYQSLFSYMDDEFFTVGITILNVK